jgi:predicted nucleic acid-binding protein
MAGLGPPCFAFNFAWQANLGFPYTPSFGRQAGIQIQVLTAKQIFFLDTSVYIGIFNRGRYTYEINWFNKVTYLVLPVLHELWMDAKGKSEIRRLIRFGNTFVKLGRLVQPAPATQIKIGRVCQKLRSTGKLDPRNPRQYNDVCIALLAAQIGATVVTLDIGDFKGIQNVVDFSFRDVIIESIQ